MCLSHSAKTDENPPPTPALAIRGCNTIILNQAFSEKTLMKNIPMCYIGVTEGKIEKFEKKKAK